MANKSIAIIGSGMGGLVAGNLLATKGHKVTIFESHSAPGGYTAGFYRKGFYFESGTLSFEASASIFKAMADMGLLENISFVRHKGRFVSQDFDCLLDSYQDFKKMLYGAFASERDKLDRYFAEVDRIYDASSLSVGRPIPLLFSGVDFLLSVASFIVGARKSMKILQQYADVTIEEFSARFFEKESKIYRLLTTFGYPHMGAWIIGGAMTTMFDDYWTVYGGMQSWADALSENFRKLGGQLKLNSYVDKILTRNGAVVRISSNNMTFDTDCVIAACDYKKTFLRLLDNKSLVPAKLQEKIKNAAVSEGVFTVYLGLNVSNDELRKNMKRPYVIYFDERPGANVHDPDDEHFFEKASFSLYSPSMMNSNLAPAGKSSLMIQTLSPPDWMQNWGGGDKQLYKQLKESVKKTLIEKARAVVPNLGKFVEFEDAATPLTYERYTHNTAGASSAWSWNPKKKFFPDAMSVNIETPVKNLYIGSCWAMQIGGVPGALMAAYLCAKKIK